MWQELKTQLKPALAMLAWMTLLLGIGYPLLMTGLAQALFHRQANGSLMREGERIIGSELIGQPFVGDGYFWGRPSATSPTPYNAAASTGSNLGPTNPALTEAVEKRIAALRAAEAGAASPVPVDLATASASGLDPDITPAAALYQAPRVARARGLSEEAVRRLIQDHGKPRTLGLFGEPRVNVLELNLALDKLAAGK
ncbi:MAG: potassium-transporting ATPase subunit KdpC [Candidatus Sumerlaeota bacterium]|nr:potassium-transporting ATPase subunit KdpC [Candidatus Sumerlaeota bacterium]